MTVNRLKEILAIVDSETEVKIKSKSWELQDKECFISSVNVSADETGKLTATLNYETHEELQNKD